MGYAWECNGHWDLQNTFVKPVRVSGNLIPYALSRMYKYKSEVQGISRLLGNALIVSVKCDITLDMLHENFRTTECKLH